MKRNGKRRLGSIKAMRKVERERHGETERERKRGKEVERSKRGVRMIGRSKEMMVEG